VTIVGSSQQVFRGTVIGIEVLVSEEETCEGHMCGG
jgi:hypothetical protein